MAVSILKKGWIWILVLLASLGLMAYTWLDVPKSDYISLKERANNPLNQHLIDSGMHFLQQGDIVVRTGNDITSAMFCKMNRTDKTFSHCGIVMIEDGYPFIYHSIGGEDNPDETLRRDSASFWFSPKHNLGFGILRFGFTPVQIDSLNNIVMRYYTAKKKFDMDFNLRDDSKLYCAEFVYNAINHTMGDSAFIGTTTLMGKEYVAIDNFTQNTHAQSICQVRYK